MHGDIVSHGYPPRPSAWHMQRHNRRHGEHHDSDRLHLHGLKHEARLFEGKPYAWASCWRIDSANGLQRNQVGNAFTSRGGPEISIAPESTACTQWV